MSNDETLDVVSLQSAICIGISQEGLLDEMTFFSICNLFLTNCTSFNVVVHHVGLAAVQVDISLIINVVRANCYGFSSFTLILVHLLR